MFPGCCLTLERENSDMSLYDKLTSSGVAIALMFVLACNNKPPRPSALSNATQQALAVEAMVVQPQRLGTSVIVPGTILPEESTMIYAEVAGRITELNIREGAYVNKGALLVKLYDGDLQAQLRKLEVQLAIADKTEQRQAELLRIQGISQQEYDLSLLQVNNLKADMDITREAILKTEIRAPFSGRIGLRNVSPGAYVTPTTVLTTISQVNRLKIQFNVPERYGPQLTQGLPISFSVDGVDKEFTATVLATEVSINEASRTLAVRAQVKEPDNTLIPGAFARVQIGLDQNDNALMIPNITVVPQGRLKLIYLYKNGKAARVEVATGIRDSLNVEVVSGLKPGDTLITSSILFLRPGIDVEISSIQ